MSRNIQHHLDEGLTYEELLSQGIATTDDLESYESSFSIPEQDVLNKPKKVKSKKTEPKTTPLLDEFVF
jgi:hypothetical protein